MTRSGIDPRELPARDLTLPPEHEWIVRTRRWPSLTQFDFLHLRGLLADLAEQLPGLASEGDYVLDVYCGTRPYEDLLAAGVHVIGLDVTDRFGVADVVSDEFLPFVDAAFDAVVCFEGLHYVPDPVEAAKELARVLRPGGRLLITVPLCWPYDRNGVEHRWTGPGLAALFADWEEVTVREQGGRGVVWALLTGQILELARIRARRRAGTAARLVDAAMTSGRVAANVIGAAVERADDRRGQALPMNLMLTARRPHP